MLDLRGNPGGLLTSAVDVASALIPPGEDIVSARGRGFPSLAYKSKNVGRFAKIKGGSSPSSPSSSSGDSPLGLDSVGPALLPGTPLIVLTNSGTASAAEIVAGCIQDLDLGVIVGDRTGTTFGKGLVQNVAELPGETALKYTVAKYYTPSGRCIQSIDYSKNSEKDKSEMGERKGKSR